MNLDASLMRRQKDRMKNLIEILLIVLLGDKADKFFSCINDEQTPDDHLYQLK